MELHLDLWLFPPSGATPSIYYQFGEIGLPSDFLPNKWYQSLQFSWVKVPVNSIDGWLIYGHANVEHTCIAGSLGSVAWHDLLVAWCLK